ncbi:MAG: nicotinate-nucleotide adenylyltransferase, partial [Anaerolineaceae bacterium]|nr:nicotinate-nucleotide adenylyltransferase [Anaerolineaceae bacterium]
MAGLIGVFGGTFDPPHLGHLILAAEAYDQLGLDRLLWVLTPDPPHKLEQHISRAEMRLALVQAAICDNPHFELSRVDLDRMGPHFAVDTVRLLAQDFPAAEMIYLMGGDSLHDLPTWRLPLELVHEVDAFGVMRRPGDDIDLSHLEQALPGLTEKVRFVDAPLLEISSSQIRYRIRTGKPFRYYLPPPVYDLVIAG